MTTFTKAFGRLLVLPAIVLTLGTVPARAGAAQDGARGKNEQKPAAAAQSHTAPAKPAGSQGQKSPTQDEMLAAMLVDSACWDDERRVERDRLNLVGFSLERHKGHADSVRRRFWGRNASTPANPWIKTQAVVYAHAEMPNGSRERFPMVFARGQNNAPTYMLACEAKHSVVDSPRNYPTFTFTPQPPTQPEADKFERHLLGSEEVRFHSSPMLPWPRPGRGAGALTYESFLSAVVPNRGEVPLLEGWAGNVDVSVDDRPKLHFTWPSATQIGAGGQEVTAQPTTDAGLGQPLRAPKSFNGLATVTVDLSRLSHAEDLSPVLRTDDNACGNFRRTRSQSYIGICEGLGPRKLEIGRLIAVPVDGDDWTVDPATARVSLEIRTGNTVTSCSDTLGRVLDRGCSIKAEPIQNIPLPAACNSLYYPRLSDLLQSRELSAEASGCAIAETTVPKAWLDVAVVTPCVNDETMPVKTDQGKVRCIHKKTDQPILRWGRPGWSDVPLSRLRDGMDVGDLLAPDWPWAPNQVPAQNGETLPITVAEVAYCPSESGTKCCPTPVTPSQGSLPPVNKADCPRNDKLPEYLKITFRPQGTGAGLDAFDQVVRIGTPRPALQMDRARPELALTLPVVPGFPASGTDIRLFSDGQCRGSLDKRQYLPPDQSSSERVYPPSVRPPLYAQAYYGDIPLTPCTPGARRPEGRITFDFPKAVDPTGPRNLVVLSPGEGLKQGNRQSVIISALQEWIANHAWQGSGTPVGLLVFSTDGQLNYKFRSEYVYAPGRKEQAKQSINALDFSKSKGETLRDLDLINTLGVNFERLIFIADTKDLPPQAVVVQSWLYSERRIDVVTIGDCATWVRLGAKPSGQKSDKLTCHSMGTDGPDESSKLRALLNSLSR